MKFSVNIIVCRDFFETVYTIYYIGVIGAGVRGENIRFWETKISFRVDDNCSRVAYKRTRVA